MKRKSKSSQPMSKVVKQHEHLFALKKPRKGEKKNRLVCEICGIELEADLSMNIDANIKQLELTVAKNKGFVPDEVPNLQRVLDRLMPDGYVFTVMHPDMTFTHIQGNPKDLPLLDRLYDCSTRDANNQVEYMMRKAQAEAMNMPIPDDPDDWWKRGEEPPDGIDESSGGDTLPV